MGIFDKIFPDKIKPKSSDPVSYTEMSDADLKAKQAADKAAASVKAELLLKKRKKDIPEYQQEYLEVSKEIESVKNDRRINSYWLERGGGDFPKIVNMNHRLQELQVKKSQLDRILGKNAVKLEKESCKPSLQRLIERTKMMHSDLNNNEEWVMRRYVDILSTLEAISKDIADEDNLVDYIDNKINSFEEKFSKAKDDTLQHYKYAENLGKLRITKAWVFAYAEEWAQYHRPKAWAMYQDVEKIPGSMEAQPAVAS